MHRQLRRFRLPVLALAAGLTALGGIHADAVTGPDVGLSAAHEQRIREGSEASRSAPPGAVVAKPDNGIVQIPIDTRVQRPTVKANPSEPVSPGPRVAVPTMPNSAPPCPYTAGMKTASLVKAFSEVAWHVCVRDMGLKGMWVGPVELQRTPGGPWMPVLYQAGLAEIFVPYNGGTFRPYDMQYCPTGGCALDQVSAQDAGPTGSLVTLTNESVPTVVAEVRDRGVAWLCKQNTAASRRGQEFVIWSVTDGGNYDNLVQMSFRDDGAMTFRIGNTGFNNPQLPREAHMHNALWRVDMDLGGWAWDSASLLEHSEPDPTALQATEIKTPFDGNSEGGVAWNPTRLTSLLVEDLVPNSFGSKRGYEFTSSQLATARHYGSDDDWTQKDFYTTVYHPNELGWTTAFQPPDNYLLAQIANNEPVSNRDIVVWVKSSVHHVPTDEDRSAADLGNVANTTGVTLAHWSGFDVTPRNLFDANPMGGPTRCG